MRCGDADDYGRPGAAGAAGPLFDAVREGPFALSKMTPTACEMAVAQVIWGHAGRANPISIAAIIERFATANGPERMSARTVKGVVEQLRVTHRCPIGARREEPAGYFWIVDEADREAAVRPYREQILSMWRTLRVLDSREKLRELQGQLRLED